MNSYFCETIFKCPTLYILSDKPIDESLIPYYSTKFIDRDDDELIKQIYFFLIRKTSYQKIFICVKGSDLVYLNDIKNIDSFLVKLREKATNQLVKAIFEDHKDDKLEFLSDRVDNIISNSEYKYLYLYKVNLVASSNSKAGSIRELIRNKSTLYLKDGEKITSLVCTFNQGQAKIENKDEMIKNFNRILEKNNYPHLVIFGLQECALDVIPDLMKDKYNRIGTGSLSQHSLGFMYLHIFVKKMKGGFYERREITIESMNVTTDSCGNWLEFKGSIVIPIKISYHEKYQKKHQIINFVNVHLPSKPNKITERNNCLKRSTEKLTDNIFVFGDMNYRTSNIHKVPLSDQIKVINESKDCGCSNNTIEYIEDKLQNDQLIIELQNDDYMKQFKEESIKFCPSCRLKEYSILPQSVNQLRCSVLKSSLQAPGDASRDTNYLYDVHRYPSWCDRILYKIINDSNKIDIDFDSYNSEHVTMMSDHNLVSLKFSINITRRHITNYYNKYLKYKQKYLKLKNKYNHL